ncbi:hypothetical protein OIU78_028370 [Salix suchowensis]|nr:hypothetical protein OIU78_028370 [Salix suchowensis]
MLSLPTLTFPPKPLSIIPKSSFSGIQIRQKCPISVVLPSIKMTRSSVITMAKKEEELKEIRAKTTEEINEEVVELKGELLMLRLQKSTRNEFKSSEFRRMRKRVSRFLPYPSFYSFFLLVSSNFEILSSGFALKFPWNA